MLASIGKAYVSSAVYKKPYFLLQVTRESISVLLVTRESVSVLKVTRESESGTASCTLSERAMKSKLHYENKGKISLICCHWHCYTCAAHSNNTDGIVIFLVYIALYYGDACIVQVLVTVRSLALVHFAPLVHAMITRYSSCKCSH